MSIFRQLVFLNKAHGWFVRGLAGAVAFVAVLIASGRVILARHAAGLWFTDQFTVGSHVLRWHLSQGWTGRFIRTTPEFDVSAVMDADATACAMQQLGRRVEKNRNASWGHSPQRDRFEMLKFLARQFHETGDAAPFQDVANLIASDLCHNPAAAVPATKPNNFTIEHARDALVSIGTMFDGISAPWYLVSGTFLGAVRELDFLSHDYDIDVGINIEDLQIDQLRAAILANADLTLVNENPYIHQTSPIVDDHRHALIRVMHRSGIEIDVFIHHLDEGERWHGSTTHRWTNSEFSLADYTISGIPVRGPDDADRYLTENYGNWKVPVKVFNCSTGTPNVSFNKNLFSIGRLLHGSASATEAFTDPDAEISRMILMQEGYLTQTETGWNFTVPWVT